MSNILEVRFEEGQTFATATRLWKGDYGQILLIHGPALPAYYEVHFASTKADAPQIQVGTPEGVLIPNKFLQTDGYIYAWTFLHTGVNDGETKYQIKIPVEDKGIPIDQETPEEKTAVQQAVEALNKQTGVATEAAASAEGSAKRAEEAAASVDKEMIVEVVSGYLDDHPITVDETDPTVPGWAKQPEKPTYTAAEVGALPDTYTPPVDSTLTQSGQAADAAKVGDKINSLSEEIGNLQTSILTTAQVKALDGMFKVCAFIKADVSEEYNAFCTAFGIEAATITGISATYSGDSVAVGTAVTDLTGIVVTANYSDGSKKTVTGYTLSGTIAEGSNTITVTYEGMTTTFTVTGVAEEVTLTSISATYSGGDVTVGTAVTDLTGIVVTAHYSDGSTATVTGYTLSGTIAEGSNTVTVTYQGKTATFTVTGVAESGVSNETTWTDGVAYTYTSVKDEYLETNGTIAQYNGWDRTPYLYCAGASKLRVVVKNAMSSILSSSQYNGFFDENKNFISQFKYNTIDQNTVGAYVDVLVPADAVYFVASGVNTVITDYLSNGPAVSFTPYK